MLICIANAAAAEAEPAGAGAGNSTWVFWVGVRDQHLLPPHTAGSWNGTQSSDPPLESSLEPIWNVVILACALPLGQTLDLNASFRLPFNSISPQTY